MESDKKDRASLWNAFKNVAIVFSFIVNFTLILLLLLLGIPALRTTFALKTGLVEPLVNDLDSAFVGLGDATIKTTVQIDKSIPIQFDLPLDESLPISFDLPISQHTTVILRAPVSLNEPATFTFPNGGGQIHGIVSLSLPAGMALPVTLNMVVPVNQDVPVQLDVPVDQNVPIQMDVPVAITLGESGLDPVVDELRGALEPIKDQINRLPDGVAGLP